MNTSLLLYAEKIIKTLDELSEYTVDEIQKFYYVNNYSVIVINESQTRIIKEDFSNLLFIKLERELPKILNTQNKQILKQLSIKISEIVNQPGNFARIGKSLREDSEFIYGLEEPGNIFKRASYDFEILRYFSIPDDLITELIEEQFNEPQPIKESGSLFLFNSFDVNLYDTVLNNPQLLQTFDWRTFEKLIAKLLETFEYEVELLSGTKDGGIDVIAIKKDDYFGAHRYILQAKRWKNKIGIEPVRQLAFLQKHIGASKACLITTSKFTSGAWELANLYRWQLELKDQQGLLNWIALAKLIKQ